MSPIITVENRLNLPRVDPIQIAIVIFLNIQVLPPTLALGSTLSNLTIAISDHTGACFEYIAKVRRLEPVCELTLRQRVRSRIPASGAHYFCVFLVDYSMESYRARYLIRPIISLVTLSRARSCSSQVLSLFRSFWTTFRYRQLTANKYPNETLERHRIRLDDLWRRII